MTKFFIPEMAGYKQQGEELYQSIRKRAAERFRLGDRRIRSITFRDVNLGKKKGKWQTLTATVGRDDPYDIGMVFAILEESRYTSPYGDPPSEGYLVYTTKRGVLGGDPYRLPVADKQDVELFDP
jgi:hypothetical protein